MPKFHWKGRSAAGHEIEGNTSAASEDAVVAQLRGQGIMVTTISITGGAEMEPSGSSAPAPPADARPVSISERLARDRATSKPQPFRGR
jgi:type II secretory pathway component PulF